MRPLRCCICHQLLCTQRRLQSKCAKSNQPVSICFQSSLDIFDQNKPTLLRLEEEASFPSFWAVLQHIFCMGVKELWSILEPTREKKCLNDFEGKRVAVDLGFWICQMKTAVTNPSVIKPHLRNLFFRTVALLQRDIQPIFVLDGAPPDLKQDAMRQRQIQSGKYGRSVALGGTRKSNPKKMKRSRFMTELKECADLIRLIGLPVIESEGEAEGTCAFLNQQGMVDAVITDDGDAFLYGASCVLRNFSLDGKQPMVDCYRLDRISEELSLDREKLIVLGLLIGCDYCPKGVSGVGREMALKLLNLFTDGESALERLKLWRKPEAKPENKAEAAIMKRVSNFSDFPDQRVIDEFLCPKWGGSDTVVDWKEPVFSKLTMFLKSKIEWEETYAVSKVVPLISLWNLRAKSRNVIQESALDPVRILKDRVKNGVACFEIQWKKLECDSFGVEEFYVTLEQARLFEAAFPQMVATHKELLSSKKRGKGKKNKTEKVVLLEPDPKENLDNSIICIADSEDEDADDFRKSFLLDNCAPVVSEGHDKNDEEDLRSLSERVEAMDFKPKVLEKEPFPVEESSSPLPLRERLMLKGLFV